MKKNELEKYIDELSPEMQAKARQCKDMDELNALLADNEVELSEDALEAVSGGCSLSSDKMDIGDAVTYTKMARCPSCGGQLYYFDMCYNEKGCTYITRMNCKYIGCSSYNNGLWYAEAYSGGPIKEKATIHKY